MQKNTVTYSNSIYVTGMTIHQ